MLELYFLTFNCARNFIDPESLAPPFFDALPPSASVPDIVAISLQEISPIAYSFLGGSYLDPYYERVTATVQLAAKIRSHGGEQLEHVATRNSGMTAIMVFAKPQVSQRIRWIQAAETGVGVWDMGNKGAVAVRIGVASKSSNDNTLGLAFTAAHLAPMECNIKARNQDWENIVRNLVFENIDSSALGTGEEQPLLSTSDSPSENEGLFAPGTHLFFAGDLNYRTHDKPPGPKDYQSYPQPTESTASPLHFSHLLNNDQLGREREANRTLHGLEELPIEFPPTYKYSMHRSKALAAHKRSTSDLAEKWAWAKHRYPSWCDRILFLSPPPSAPRFKPHDYTALPVQATSDHRPVALSISIDDAPLRPSDLDSIRSKPPFPINPDWKVRRDNARRLEVVVGILSYLALTKKGNAIIVAVAGIAFTSWWMATWLTRR